MPIPDRIASWLRFSRNRLAIGVLLLAALTPGCVERPLSQEPDLSREETPSPLDDSEAQRAMVDGIGERLADTMANRTPQDALLIDLDSLYAPLDPSQRQFMEAIRHLDGADPSLGVDLETEWVRVEGQRVATPEGEKTLPLQLLPRDVWQAYDVMNAAMKAAIGNGLLVGSGYRSPAHQLFIFVRYMPAYAYSVDRTKAHVSLPGASDHNHVERQGIDFVTENGVDLRYSDAEAFRVLPEHDWLLENAQRFGFRGEGPQGLSPWHWHFVGKAREHENLPRRSGDPTRPDAA